MKMGTLIMPDLYILFTDTETHVVDTFGNVVKVFPHKEDDEDVLEANRYIDEERNKRRWKS